MDDQAYDSYLRQLQGIHQLRDELELGDDAYRELLERLTGSRSAKSMSGAQRQAVISFMRTYRELDIAVAHAEQAREELAGAFRRGVSEDGMDKEAYLAGELLHSSKASIETIMQALREQYGPDLRLVGARELREGSRSRLRLEFDRLPF